MTHTEGRSSQREIRVPRVAVLPSDDGPCGFYRVLQPLALLEKQGKITLELHRIPRVGFAITNDLMRECDVTVIQRLSGTPPVENPDPEQEHAMAFDADVRRYGERIVYEVDDDLEHVPKNNPSYRGGPWHARRSQATRDLMRACRLVTTTTHEAAIRLQVTHPQRRVIPNGLNLETWRPPGYVPRCDEEPIGQVRIAYAASRMHAADVQLLLNPWRQIARANPNVKFVLAGHPYPELMTALGNRIEYAGAVSEMSEWPAFARSLRADIWVAPLVDSRFSRSKSNLKWLEATACGAAMVASDVVTYNRGPDGKPWFVPPMGLVRSTVEWCIALQNLVDHPKLRRELAHRSLELVQQNYAAQNSADAWMRVIEEVAGCSPI